MSDLKPCLQEVEALDILEAMLDVCDLDNPGPMFAGQHVRGGICKIMDDDATKLRHYIAHRRAQPAKSRFANCHIWEPGDRLDTISDKCDVLIKAADIKALMAQPVNEPLTLDELREMDGEPVWVVDGNVHCWMIVERADNLLMHFAEKEDCGVGLPFTGYGKTWFAYARKPEGSENDAKV